MLGGHLEESRLADELAPVVPRIQLQEPGQAAHAGVPGIGLRTFGHVRCRRDVKARDIDAFGGELQISANQIDT